METQKLNYWREPMNNLIALNQSPENKLHLVSINVRIGEIEKRLKRLITAPNKSLATSYGFLVESHSKLEWDESGSVEDMNGEIIYTGSAEEVLPAQKEVLLSIFNNFLVDYVALHESNNYPEHVSCEDYAYAVFGILAQRYSIADLAKILAHKDKIISCYENSISVFEAVKEIAKELNANLLPEWAEATVAA